MEELLTAIAVTRLVARRALLALALLLAVIALLDWAVRERKLNPFGAVARFMRRWVDPRLVPLERRVVRFGGRPSAAPLWALGVVVVGGLLLLALLDLVAAQVVRTAGAMEAGPRGIIALVVLWVFALLRLALIVRVLSSWLPVSPQSPWIRWTYPLTEWILRPLRRVIPPFGPVDISPIAAYFGLYLLEAAVLTLLT
jgi:YggT family protein